MAEGIVRFEIGFLGSGTLGGAADAGQVQALQDAVRDGAEGVVELTVEGSALVVRPSQVAWLRTHQRESRVGF